MADNNRMQNNGRDRARSEEPRRESRYAGRDDDGARRSESRGRDEAPQNRLRGDEPRGGRSARDDGGRGRDRDESPTRSGSGRGFSYQSRGVEGVKARQVQGANDFDRIVADGIKQYSPKKGRNTVRFLPPTWPNAKHFGYDIFVHYGIGPDRQSYLDLYKMKGEPDPVTDEIAQLRRSGDADEDELRTMDSKKRVGVFLVDRDEPDEGVQFWAMPWTIDKELSLRGVDKSDGSALEIDHPESGYDVEFMKEGEKKNTKYVGVDIARRPSRLGREEWLDYAVDNPIPDILQFYSYDEIAKAFGGGGALRESEDSDARPRDRSDRGNRDDQPAKDRGRGNEDRDDRPESPRRRSDSEATHTWESVHNMTGSELDALCAADERLNGIDPNAAESDAELALWVCEELGVSKPEPRRDRSPSPAGDDVDAKLAGMRRERR